MKRKAFLRGLLGFPLGISIGYIITIFISLVFGQGHYIACVPALVEATGSEINAVMLQAMFCGLLGFTFCASSVIWEMENWSIVKQTGLYFLITSIVMMPIAYFTNWMKHSMLGFLTYFGVFAAIFIVIWFIQYLVWKYKIKNINSKIQ